MRILLALKSLIIRFCRLIARFAVLPAARILDRLLGIRLTPLHTARLGHLAINTYLYVAGRRMYGPEKGIRRLFFGANPCNRTLFEMWKREIPILESRWLTAFYMYSQDILGESPVFGVLPHDIGRVRVENAHEIVDRIGGVLQFTLEEEKRGRALLAAMGLSPRDWFVCFQARDAGYHQARINKNPHDFRNADIRACMEAMHYVADRGGVAIRIGANVNEPLPKTENPRIIDYATRFRSDFGDIYLLGKCRFFLGGDTGSSLVPTLFGVPVATANKLPILPNPNGRKSLYIPKLLRDRPSGQPLPFDEQFAPYGPLENYYTTARHWNQRGAFENDWRVIVDNTPDEILDLCRDMFDVLDGREPDQEAANLQRFYQNHYLAPLPDIRDHGPRISPRFIKRHKNLLPRFAEKRLI